MDGVNFTAVIAAALVLGAAIVAAYRAAVVELKARVVAGYTAATLALAGLFVFLAEKIS
jgi:hypothetical protein